jgi:NAD(P)-dependent dehydrogenase (short-subunit alcohol dehydrogenase family)
MIAATKKVALISGANKGIGLETARQLGKLDITVLLGARDLARGEAAAEELKKEGVDARAVKLDVLDAADVKAAVAYVEKEFGVLDILVNNAGMSTEGLGYNSTLTVTDENLRKTFDTNFFAVISVTNAFLPLLRKSGAGRIVNVSSILGSLTFHATPGSPIYEAKIFAYDASKSALNAYTIHLAYSLKDTKIKVNSAHPGWVKTDMGTDAAPMELVDGAKTEVMLATLGEDGPTGGYFHMGEALPW